MNLLTLDKAGRVVIPKIVRDQLHLEPGDTLQLESESDSLTLRPVRSSAPLKKKQGIWVFHGGGKISAVLTDKLQENLRAERNGSAGLRR